MTTWIITAGVELVVIVVLGILLLISTKRLKDTRNALQRARRNSDRPRRRRGIAPRAIETAFHTADSLLNKGLGATVRNSIEDLAGWARIERPDLARMTADGHIVIAFSDIEGSTARNEELGDRQWLKLLERHNKLITTHAETHGGHIVKNQGDGFMIAFTDPAQAIRCGLRIQHALSDHPERWNQIQIRIGIHQGTSVRRGDDLFGLNVAMAARVAGQAHGGEILVSESVRDATIHIDDISLGPPRALQLKGITGTHPLYPVQKPTESSLS